MLAPLPYLTKEEYDFFEMVREGDPDEVAAFLQSDSFKEMEMDINKTNKNVGHNFLTQFKQTSLVVCIFFYKLICHNCKN